MNIILILIGVLLIISTMIVIINNAKRPKNYTESGLEIFNEGRDNILHGDSEKKI